MATSTYKVLLHNDLTKRGGVRVDIFLQKIKDGEEFLTTKGLATININEYDRLSAEMRKSGYSTQLQSKIGAAKVTLSYPKDFFKTPEFGGKGVGFGTAAEDRYLSMFRKEIETIIASNNQPYIDMKIGKRVVQCIGVQTTKQTGRYAAKADFSLVGINGKEVAWISHKAGTSAKDFQQYGGVTDKIFAENQDVKNFVSDINKKYPDGLSSGITLYRKVSNNDVVGLAVYGLRYKSQTRDNENIDEFHQGVMTLSSVSGGYTIKSSHKGINGDIPTGEYTAYYVARYTNNVKYLGVKNARLGIFALGKIPNSAKEI